MNSKFPAKLERKPRLQFQAPVVSGLGEIRSAGVARSRGLIRLSEQRWGDVADNRSRIRVVPEVSDGN